jgi:hypothetical protein
MAEVAVQIVRFVEEHQPAMVACELLDAEGHTHTLIDKDAMFTNEWLNAESDYPQAGRIRCEILDRWQDKQGRELIRITTAKPDWIESTDSKSELVVLATQLL